MNCAPILTNLGNVVRLGRMCSKEAQFKIIEAISKSMHKPKEKHYAILMDIAHAYCDLGAVRYDYLAKIFHLPLYKTAFLNWKRSADCIEGPVYMGLSMLTTAFEGRMYGLAMDHMRNMQHMLPVWGTEQGVAVAQFVGVIFPDNPAL